MKILHIINDLDYGGAEKVLSNVYKKSKFENYIISLTNHTQMLDSFENKNNIKIFKFNKNFFIFEFIKLVLTFKKISPDVTIGWMYHSCIIAIILKLFSKTVVIFNIRQSLYALDRIKNTTYLIIKICGYLSKFSNINIFNSRKSIEQHSLIGFKTFKSIYIPNGVDINFSIDDKKIKELKKQYKISDENLVIGIIANFKPWKEFQIISKTIENLIYENKNIKFILIGRDVNEHNHFFKKYITESIYQDKVFLCGVIKNKDIYNYISLFSLYLSTSSNEGFSNSILENLSMHKLCLTSNVGETAPFLSKHNLVFNKIEDQVITKKILDTLNLEKKDLTNYYSDIKNYVSEYSEKNMIKNYENLIKKLII